MREIKFRGKRVDNGKWVYGGLLYSGNYYFIVEYLLYRSDKNNCDIGINYRVLPETVGQFTGLHDKNGKEIYEGDVVEYFRDVDGEVIKHVIYEITWLEDFAMFAIKPRKIIANKYDRIIGTTEFHEIDMKTSFEIIGNIHDNPELLEE